MRHAYLLLVLTPVPLPAPAPINSPIAAIGILEGPVNARLPSATHSQPSTGLPTEAVNAVDAAENDDSLDSLVGALSALDVESVLSPCGNHLGVDGAGRPLKKRDCLGCGCVLAPAHRLCIHLHS